MPKKPVGRMYEVRTKFRAPLGFVFRWCTDYSGQDGELSGEGYARKLLRRTRNLVVFEDLYTTDDGWVWIHREVSLRPPDGWHADSVGSDRALSVDYRLESVPDGGTLLTIRARRRPYGIGRRNPAKSVWERGVARNWGRLGRVLDRDYEKTVVAARGRSR